MNGNIYTNSHITASGNISSSGTGSFANINLSGDISSSGTGSFRHLHLQDTRNSTQNIRIKRSRRSKIELGPKYQMRNYIKTFIEYYCKF